MERFKTTPYKHQIEFLNRFSDSEICALLSDMGTGKSWMTINKIAHLWGSGNLDAVLILAPNGVHINWILNEIPTHMPDWVKWHASYYVSAPNKKEKENVESLFGDFKERTIPILTMNWDAIRTKNGFAIAEKFCKKFPTLMIVCDESTTIKNPKSETTKATFKLKKYSKYRMILDGTPIDNSPFDAFSQFGFLSEDILQTSSFYSFKAEYAQMATENNWLIKNIMKKKTKINQGDIEKINEALNILSELIYKNNRIELINLFEEVKSRIEDGFYKESLESLQKLKDSFSPNSSQAKTKAIIQCVEIVSIIGKHLRKVSYLISPERLPQIVEKDKSGKPQYRNINKLRQLIAPYSFRVMKSDCLDLPEKIYKTIYYKLTNEQIDAYQKAQNECRISLGEIETPISKLTAVGKLSQITSGYYLHPHSDAPVKIPGENPRLELLEQNVQKFVENGEKIIIWARYKVQIKDIVEILKKNEIEHVEYHGDINDEDRVSAIENFQNGASKVFVANQQTGATGITLTAATIVIYYSNDFRLRHRLQSEDRAHRIGQKRNVVYVDLVAKGTVDEKIVKSLQDKKDIADRIVNSISEFI